MHTRRLRSAAPRLVTRRLVALLALVMATSGLLVSQTQVALAADAPPPGDLTPSSGTQAGIPTLAWDRVAGADRYDVQVSSSSSFANAFGAQTRNHSWTPDRNLAPGTIFWRVRVTGSSDNSWAIASFGSTPGAAPTPVGPADGSRLEQPGSPPVLSWTDVPGALVYSVQITTDPNFADPESISTVNTDGLTSVAMSLQKPATYYWRVRGDLGNGVLTDWSTSRSYTTLGLPAAKLTSPPDDINNAITDVVLDWEPVAGASTYDLQVSTDRNFSTLDYAVDSITSTRFSPPPALRNNQYYWRVRPVDAANNRIDWSAVPIWKFRRSWSAQPQPVYPANQASVGDPFYFQWTAVDHASRYVVQLSRDVGFSSIVGSCSTVHTTVTMGADAGNCFPGARGGYYWRVLAYDSPTEVPTVELSSTKWSFSYVPDTVRALAPADGATVEIPTMSWRPVARAEQYRLVVTDTKNDSVVINDSTYATSFTPTDLADGVYRWAVIGIGADGRVGSSLLPEAQPTFKVEKAKTPVTNSTPTPETIADGYRFPTLRWSRMTNAARYQVFLKTRIAQGFSPMAGSWAFPAAEDRGTDWLAPGDYDFYVTGYSDSGGLLGSGPVGHFSIKALPPVDPSSYVAALSGNAVTGNGGMAIDTCSAVLPSSCQNLRQTPVLGWQDPNPNVGSYRLIVSNDAELTNRVPGFDNLSISSTLWSPTSSLPDGQAGSAYFYELLPCTARPICNAPFVAQNAFNKLGRAVSLVSPADNATVADDVTLTWTDYLETLRTPDSQGDPDSATPLDTPAATEARTYRVQVADNPNFQNLIAEIEVDQTTFTLFSGTYPEGPNYWRVRAFDGSNHPLPWSTTRMFQKTSPVPVLVSPIDNATPQRGDLPFSWNPLPFARSYDIEVYRKDGNPPSPSNLAASGSAAQVVGTLNRALPASATPYQWRVARRDAVGRRGAWSVMREFTVLGKAPTLLSPLTGAPKVAPSDSSFSWSVVPNAALYRWELRPAAGNTNNGYDVRTPALAFSPLDTLPGGDWTWRVTAIDRDGRDLGTSPSNTFTVVDSVLARTPVQINGNGMVGTQLTVTDGTPTWNTDTVGPVTTTWQWRRNGNPIAGQTSPSYLLTADDLNQSITVTATGRAASYKDGSSTSNAVQASSGATVVSTAKPSIEGTAIVGNELSAKPGSWPYNPSYAYEWQRDGAAIPGATGTRYTLVNADAGHQVRIKITATAAGYSPGVDYSDPLTVAQRKLAASSRPTISGTPVVGALLTANPGGWPANPQFTYVWLRDTAPIPGAAGSTYVVTAADAGHQLAVLVSATAVGYDASDPTPSDPVLVARQGLAPASPPTISGNAIVRGVVSANPGTWPGSPIFTYVWTRDNVAINGATQSAYTIVPADAGDLIAVRVTATAGGYEPGQATSGSLKVAKQSSTTTITLSAKKLSKKARAKATVKVVVNGVVDPTGSIKVYDGTRIIATVALKAGGSGQIVVRLPRLKKGKHVLKAEYAGDDSTAGSTSGGANVKVVVKTVKKTKKKT